MRFRGLSYAGPALIVLAILMVANALKSDLLAPGNWDTTAAVMSPFIIVSMAQVPAVMSGNGDLDLSVGPVTALVSALVVAKLVPAGIESPLLVVPIALAAGAGIGLVNGLLVAYVRVPAIVATLGTYLICSAVALELLPNAGGTAPGWLSDLSSGVLGPIPGLVIVLAVVGAGWTLLQRTAFRRNLLAVGGDARAAYTAGIDVALVRLSAFVLTGAIAAVGGLVSVSVLQAGDASVGPDYTLVSLAAVALGGVSLAGGRGGLLGAAAGGATLFLIQNLLGLLGLSVYYTSIAYGVALILALVVNHVGESRRERRDREQALEVPVEAVA